MHCCCFLLGRHIGLPLRLQVFFYRCCRGEPVCSPLLLHCCFFCRADTPVCPYGCWCFFVVIVGANRCVRPVIALLVFRWADTPVCPYGAGVFVVVIGANRCVRPCYCIAVVLLGRHIGLPLRVRARCFVIFFAFLHFFACVIFCLNVLM